MRSAILVCILYGSLGCPEAPTDRKGLMHLGKRLRQDPPRVPREDDDLWDNIPKRESGRLERSVQGTFHDTKRATNRYMHFGKRELFPRVANGIVQRDPGDYDRPEDDASSAANRIVGKRGDSEDDDAAVRRVELMASAKRRPAFLAGHLPHFAVHVWGIPRTLSRPSRSDRLFPTGAQTRNVFLHFG